MTKFFCYKCKINHSIVDNNGMAVCPVCNQRCVKLFQNGVPCNILSEKGKIQCIKCKVVLFANNRFQGCPNGCVKTEDGDEMMRYRYFVLKGDQEDYVHNNFIALLNIARSGFGTKMRREDVLEHLLSADMIVICTYGKTITAFTAVMIFDELLFLHGMAVNVAHQGSGIGEGMLQKVLKVVSSSQYLALTTQNPHMYSLVSKFCGDIFPNYNNIMTDSEVFNKIDKIASKLSITLSACYAGKCLVENWYGKCLYHRIPALEKTAVFRDNLRVRHWRSRDALFVFGKLKE